MKVTVVMQRNPFHESKGTYIRYRSMLKAISEACRRRGWKFKAVILEGDSVPSESIRVKFIDLSIGVEAKGYLQKFSSIYLKSPIGLLANLTKILAESNVAIFFEPYNQILPLILAKIYGLKTIFDLHNCETALASSILRSAKNFEEILSAFLWLAYACFAERIILSLSHRVVYPTDWDALMASKMGGMNKISVIPNVWSRVEFRPVGGQGTDVLFVGDMNYPPNRRAAQIIMNEIAPRVYEKKPEVRFYLVGRGAPKSSKPNVISLGYVEDLHEVAVKCRYGIAPIISGAGLKYKVYTYLLLGLDVIATPNALVGIPPQTRESIHVASDWKTFAEKIIEGERLPKPDLTELRRSVTLNSEIISQWIKLIEDLVG